MNPSPIRSPVRWGILGAAHIARKNWKAIRNAGNSTLVAVASRDATRCRQFIAECQAQAPFEPRPQALASYEALLASKEIDAVYIPLPTGVRTEWVLRAAAAGKHIVCEKPCAPTLPDLKKMIDACREHGVQFMDGVMFMHSARLEKIRQTIGEQRAIGDLKRITSAFSFRAEPEFFTQNIRGSRQLEPYGCLGDLGWYCVRLALWLMNERLPRSVTGRILSESGGSGTGQTVPSEFAGELIFDEQVSAGFYCSFLSANEEWAVITGTNGYLRLSDFVLPFYGSESTFELNQAQFSVSGCDFNMEPHWQTVPVPEYSNSHRTSQETNLFRSFNEQIISGQLNDAWPQLAWRTQTVIDACLESARAGSKAVAGG
jgi:predicted dehydrogenase